MHLGTMDTPVVLEVAVHWLDLGSWSAMGSVLSVGTLLMKSL